MIHALLFVAVLLLVGVILRHGFVVFRRLFIPASVVAGFVGLILIQLGLNIESQGLDAAQGLNTWATSVSKVLSSWPGWLIAVVFAGMLLERKPSTVRESARRVGQEGLMVWVIVLGQTAIGLLAVWLIVQSIYDVPNSMGMLIETGFAGGHGTAAAMGEVFAHPSVQLEAGKDLGMLMATCGLVYGIISGIVWINFGVRRGWVSKNASALQDSALSEPPMDKLDFGLGPIGFSRIERETIDPLLFQVILLTIAFGIGMTMQSAVMGIAGYIDGIFEPRELDAAQAQLSKRLSVSSVVDFPLFIYTLFGGLIVHKLLSAVGQAERVDGETINRLTSMAMDILVVAAIGTLNLQAVAAMVVPFSILLFCGAVWTAVCLLVISRWLLPQEHWFQLGLINYGMSTGTTATGFVLLRMVDPELDSGAAEDYALAAPLSAPFIGGGMITIALPLLLLERIPIAITAIVITGIVIAMVLIGRSLFYQPDVARERP
jgi:ESS family glutamate:Na+ symporter